VRDLIMPTWARVVAWVVVMGCVLGVAGLARAEDAQDVRGTKSGCQDVTIGAAWSDFTSSGLENAQGSGALGSGLYWTEISVANTSASLFICLAAGASCGADTTNKRLVPSGGVWVLPLRGLSTQTIALRAGAAGVTGQLCGYFRATP